MAPAFNQNIEIQNVQYALFSRSGLTAALEEQAKPKGWDINYGRSCKGKLT
jgi:hypothetical protein